MKNGSRTNHPQIDDGVYRVTLCKLCGLGSKGGSFATFFNSLNSYSMYLFHTLCRKKIKKNYESVYQTVCTTTREKLHCHIGWHCLIRIFFSGRLKRLIPGASPTVIKLKSILDLVLENLYIIGLHHWSLIKPRRLLCAVTLSLLEPVLQKKPIRLSVVSRFLGKR